MDGIINNDFQDLSSLNISLIKLLCKFLKIEIDFVQASTIGVKGKGSDLILNLCKETGSKVYLSGVSGREYLKTEDFTNNGIKVVFQEFHHPIYKQVHKPFIPCMSVIDLLFNHGEKSLDIINGKDVPVMDELFT